MRCPYCLNTDTKVIDKRDMKGFAKRRRECLKCERRFNTHETVEKVELRVIKKNGGREDFDSQKIRKGIMFACQKRLVSTEQIDNMIKKIDEKIRKKGKEVEADYIGELVMKELKKVDKVAYIRFASVYRDFADISDFRKEIRGLKK